MSRICVKNLPKYVTEDRLREHFSQKGEITDAKLMRTKDGKSRQFGFVGFRTEQEGQEAIKYFDRTYLDTCRIACELARKGGDPDIPRPWSRHSLKKENKPEDGNNIAGAKNSSLQASSREGKNSKRESEIEDPQRQEFLQVMQPRVKSKLWADDTLMPPAGGQNGKVDENINQKRKLDGKEPVRDHDQVDEPDEEEDGSEKEQENIFQDAISDMDYFKSRVKKDWSDSDSGDDTGSDDEVTDDDSNDSSQESQEGQEVQKVAVDKENVDQEDIEGKGPEGSDSELPDPGNPSSSLKDEDVVLETGRLFVRNLPYTASEDELEELFSKFGNVSQVHLVVDKDTKRSKGIAYVLFSIPECAARALEQLDNSIFQGRLLHVLPAKQKHSTEKQETNLNQTSKDFKQRREEERKSLEASGDTRAWNSLFMRSDTVVENIARKYGVSKSDFLDREADDLAVRIALGETQVIAETKKNLANAGVNVASLEEFASGKADGAKRSNHVLLVKNLPYSTSENELASTSENELARMFKKFGSLDKIVIPPTKTLALFVYPAYTTMLGHLRSRTLEDFENRLEHSLQKGERFAEAACNCAESCLLYFNRGCTDAAIKIADWDASRVGEKVRRDIEIHTSSVRNEKLSAVLSSYKNRLSEALAQPVESLLEAGGKQTWASIRKLLKRENEASVSDFSNAISGFELDQVTVDKMVETLREYARNIVEKKAREEAGKVLMHMKDRFSTAFSHDEESMPRVWTGKEDIRKITRDARSESLKLLSTMAAIRLEEKPDKVENLLFSSLMDGTPALPPSDGSVRASTDPLALTTWEEVSAEHTLITSVQCKSLWRQFKAETEFTVTQAIQSQEAHRRSNNWMPPSWAIVAMVILGFNELMLLLKNPFYLLVIFVLYLLSKALWVQMDIAGEFRNGIVPALLSILARFLPTIMNLLKRLAEAAHGHAPEGQQPALVSPQCFRSQASQANTTSDSVPESSVSSNISTVDSGAPYSSPNLTHRRTANVPEAEFSR